MTRAEPRLRGVGRLSEGLRDTASPRNLFHGPGESRPHIGEGRGVIFEIEPMLAEKLEVVESAGETAELGERLSP